LRYLSSEIAFARPNLCFIVADKTLSGAQPCDVRTFLCSDLTEQRPPPRSFFSKNDSKVTNFTERKMQTGRH